MPICLQHKWFYPIDWPQLSVMIRLNEPKTGARCAAGRMAARSSIWAMVDGGDEDDRTWRNGQGRPLPRLFS